MSFNLLPQTPGTLQHQLAEQAAYVRCTDAQTLLVLPHSIVQTRYSMQLPVLFTDCYTTLCMCLNSCTGGCDWLKGSVVTKPDYVAGWLGAVDGTAVWKWQEGTAGSEITGAGSVSPTTGV
jgi:hypothetical protein